MGGLRTVECGSLMRARFKLIVSDKYQANTSRLQTLARYFFCRDVHATMHLTHPRKKILLLPGIHIWQKLYVNCEC